MPPRNKDSLAGGKASARSILLRMRPCEVPTALKRLKGGRGRRRLLDFTDLQKQSVSEFIGITHYLRIVGVTLGGISLMIYIYISFAQGSFFGENHGMNNKRATPITALVG